MKDGSAGNSTDENEFFSGGNWARTGLLIGVIVSMIFQIVRQATGEN